MTIKTAAAKKAEAAAPAPEVADHAASAADGFAFLHDAYTWIGLSFVICVVLFIRYLMPMIGKGLDNRAAKIRDQLEQASRLRAEAEELLASYRSKQEATLKEAESIVAAAQRDAVAIRAQAEVELKQTLERRTQQAQEKIARAEAEAIQQIRTKIVDLATESARTMLAEQAANADEQAIARAISAIETQIH